MTVSYRVSVLPPKSVFSDLVHDAAGVSKARRKEKNKIFARKSRKKRKAEIEQLRDSISTLEMENKKLTSIVVEIFPPRVAIGVLARCSCPKVGEIDDSTQEASKSQMINVLADVAVRYQRTASEPGPLNLLTISNDQVERRTCCCDI